MELRSLKTQVRCIHCQAIGYAPSDSWRDLRCPLCGGHSFTDWVRVPSVHAVKKQPKALDWANRKMEDLEGDRKELHGTGTDFAGLSKPKSLIERDDFEGMTLERFDS